MECNKCNKSLKDCTCSDIDERMTKLRDNPNFIYKMCLKCEKHYERCRCDDPEWGTSHTGISLEEATGHKAPRQISNSTNSTKDGKIKFVSGKNKDLDNLTKELKQNGLEFIDKDDIENLPGNVKEKIKKLNKLGIDVKIFKGDLRKFESITSKYKKNNSCSCPVCLSKTNKSEIIGTQHDQLEIENYIKHGGKLN